jgi:predicted MPP superfamily phosphohydrolase
MRGIPSSVLIFFFLFVILVEIVSYLGIRQLMKNLSSRVRLSFNLLYFLLASFAFGILFYSFSNPEVIRQSHDYTFFYSVIAISVLNLVPKSFYALMTFFSYFIRLLISRRSQIIVLTGSFLVCFGLILVVIYSIFGGRTQVIVEQQNLYFENLPKELENFRIVQISDIHLGSFGKNPRVIKTTIQKVEELQPDLLLFTGDIVNNFSDEMNGFECYLSAFSAKYGKYAILGNHDYGDYYQWPDSMSKKENLLSIEHGLANSGFKLLLNHWEKINVKDTAFALIGVENWGHRPFPQYANLDVAMKGMPSYLFTILMSHDPAHWDAIVVPQTDIPLTLSGHTHGGQFGFKIGGLEFSPMYFIQNRWGGLYVSDNQFLYVNRGLGTIGFPGRIEMNPEVTLLILHQAKTH